MNRIFNVLERIFAVFDRIAARRALAAARKKREKEAEYRSRLARRWKP